MKKLLTYLFLLISVKTFSQTYINTGVANIQRAPTLKGYFFRNQLTGVSPKFVYWYTQQQIDSLLALNVTNANSNYIRNQNSSAQTAYAWITGSVTANAGFISKTFRSPVDTSQILLTGGTTASGAYLQLNAKNRAVNPSSAAFGFGDRDHPVLSNTSFAKFSANGSDSLVDVIFFKRDSVNSKRVVTAPKFVKNGGTSLQILLADGSTGVYQQVLSGSATLNFPSTSANSSSSLTITVTGAATGDVCGLGLPVSFLPGGQNYNFSVSCTGTDTVSITFFNNSSSSMDPSSAFFKVKVFK